MQDGSRELGGESYGRGRLGILRALLLLGIASALGGIFWIRFEQYQRISQADPPGSWTPGLWLIVSGVPLSALAIFLHVRRSPEGRAPLVPAMRVAPILLGGSGFALVIRCAFLHYCRCGHARHGDVTQEMVIDTVALLLVAASLGWSLALPGGIVLHASCVLFAAFFLSIAGYIGESGVPLVIFGGSIWFFGALCLLIPRRAASERAEDGAEVLAPP